MQWLSIMDSLVSTVIRDLPLSIYHAVIPAGPEIECDSHSLTLAASTRNPFGGRIYVKGESMNPDCVVNYTQQASNDIELTVPLMACNVKRLRVPVSASILITGHWDSSTARFLGRRIRVHNHDCGKSYNGGEPTKLHFETLCRFRSTIFLKRKWTRRIEYTGKSVWWTFWLTGHLFRSRGTRPIIVLRP